jgi:hypothetical protein
MNCFNVVNSQEIGFDEKYFWDMTIDHF